MKSQHLLVLLLAVSVSITIHGNSEGDALSAWKSQLVDPNNVLSSWDPTLVNPCTWLHITCNSNNSVTRVDLGDAQLSGPLVPELAGLTNLQYLEVFGNKLSGSIPPEFGGLTKLVSLDLYNNYFSGSIPQSLANLTSLNFLRLNSNKLTGNIPREIILLIGFGNLRIVNVSDNYLAGTVAGNSSGRFAVTTIITDPKAEMS